MGHTVWRHQGCGGYYETIYLYTYFRCKRCEEKQLIAKAILLSPFFLVALIFVPNWALEIFRWQMDAIHEEEYKEGRH